MMNRILASVVLLSIAGGAVSLIFIAAEKWMYKLTSAKIVVWINTAVLFAFVIPFYKIFNYVDGSAISFVESPLVVSAKLESMEYAFYEYIENTSIMAGVSTLWAVGVIVFLVARFMQYQLLCKKIKQNHFLVFHEEWLEVWDRLCKKEQGLENVKLIASALFSQPCVIGLWKKSVIIPASLLNDVATEDIEFLLGHELMHIKRKDVPLKLFIIVLHSLNWFNPVFYALVQSLFEWTELGCDEELLAGYSGKQRKNYMHLLTQMMIKEYDNAKVQYVSYFASADRRNLKRRVYGIMKGNGKKVSFARKIVVSSFMVLAVTGSSYIAKAADVPVNGVFSGNIEVMEEGDFALIDYDMEQQDSDVAPHDLDSEKSVENIENDGMVLLSVNSDEDVTYTIINSDGSETSVQMNTIDARHLHDIQPKQLKEHKKNNDGSCKTTYYDVVYCTKCGAIWLGDIINEQTNKPCPH